MGDEEVDKARDEVYEEFRKTVDPEEWSIFMHGDRVQWDAVQEKTHQEVKEFFGELKKAEEQINKALGQGTDAAASMINFLHHYRAGRSLTSILRDPIDPNATPTDKQLAEELLRILRSG